MEEAKELWKTLKASPQTPQVFTIQMEQIAPFGEYEYGISADFELGWRRGESARLPPMWPGFNSRTRRHMQVEFVVGSRPCPEAFPPSRKTNTSKLQFDQEYTAPQAFLNKGNLLLLFFLSTKKESFFNL